MGGADFDDNGFIDPVDLEMVMNTLLKLADDEDSERLSQEEKVSIIQKVTLQSSCGVFMVRMADVWASGDNRGGSLHY